MSMWITRFILYTSVAAPFSAVPTIELSGKVVGITNNILVTVVWMGVSPRLVLVTKTWSKKFILY